MPRGSSKARQITKYKLPESTTTKGLRPIQHKDIDAVRDLLARYLKRFNMAPEFDAEEIGHWMVHDEKTTAEQVIWSYVVEDPGTKKITDFFSFYCLESSVIQNPKHDAVRAAYLFYYATETAFGAEEKGLRERLNAVMGDALVLAKRVSVCFFFFSFFFLFLHIPLHLPFHMDTHKSRALGGSIISTPSLTTLFAVQFRRLQRPHPPRQPLVPGTAKIRPRRRAVALLYLQLPY